jgi:hypothetical protein
MKQPIKWIAVGCLVVSANIHCKPASAEQIPLPSEQWQTVVHDSNNNIVSIDKGTMSQQGNFTSFWTQVISSVGDVAVSRIYTVGDCSSGMFQALWIAQANRQGKVLTNNKANDSVTPDRLVLDAVCKNDNPVMQSQSFQAQIKQSLLESFTQNHQTTSGMFSRTRNYALH